MVPEFQSDTTSQFSVFMRRSRIPKLKTTFPFEVLVAATKRSYRNLTFGNVLARQGSSFCYKARLNFQAFSLRDMKWRKEMAVA